LFTVKLICDRELVFPKDVDVFVSVEGDTVSCGDEKAYIFQPITKLSHAVVQQAAVTDYGPEYTEEAGDYSGVGKLRPHDLRRTAITRALEGPGTLISARG
jgi:hypothetical protein